MTRMAAFVALVETRPLCAHVAQHNLAWQRVLAKRGFKLCGAQDDELILELRTESL